MLRSTALAALVATGLGVTAMVVAMALMTGYTGDLERMLIGLQGEVIASPRLGGGDFAAAPADAAVRRQRLDALLERAAEVEGVERVGRVVYGEGALESPALREGTNVVLRGVEGDDRIVRQSGGDLSVDAGGLAGAVLGKELGRRLEVEEGDVLRLVVLDPTGRRPKFRYRSLRVEGFFTVGFAEFDAEWLLVDRGVLTELSGGQGLEMVEFDLVDDVPHEPITAAVAEILGDEWIVERWQRLNEELFAALKLQELLLFLVLGLIVLVSTFNVASTLVILVRERRRDLGVLGSLGLDPGRLWWCLVAYGLFLGGVGTLLGVVVGGVISFVINEFELIRFDAEIAAIYFIDKVSFRLEPTDLLAIVTFSLAVTFSACALPAWRAARKLPATALRDE